MNTIINFFKYSYRVHSWDTETIDLNVKSDSLIGNGKIICCSAFCGIDVDFGNGPRKLKQILRI